MNLTRDKVPDLVPILRVGAIANPIVADGILIPYLTINCSTHNQLEELIDLHQDVDKPGDVEVMWRWKLFDRSQVYLQLKFKQPIEYVTHLTFNLEKHGYVVDWVLSVKGFYLQSSKYGDRASEGFGQSALLIEVPSSANIPIWDKVYTKFLAKTFKTEGLSKKLVNQRVQEHRNRNREIWFRRKIN